MTEYSNCSRTCGSGGEQQRIVRCVHEVARGSTNVVIVPDEQCTAPKPNTTRTCNQIDCPVKWVVSPWSNVLSDLCEQLSLHILIAIFVFSVPVIVMVQKQEKCVALKVSIKER